MKRFTLSYKYGIKGFGWVQYQEHFLTRWGAELIAWVYRHNKNKKDITVKEK